MEDRFEFTVNGKQVAIIVTDCTVYAEDRGGRILRGPSNVDYYYDTDRGYDCANSFAVAQQFLRNFF